MDSLQPGKLFNDPGQQKNFERWCAGIFGLGYERALLPCELAVNDTSWRPDVDFILRVGSSEFPFQITEIQEPGRRRGHEFKVPADRPRRSWAESERMGKEKGPAWIHDGVARKAKKYGKAGRDLNILVYSDFSTEQLRYEDVSVVLGEFRGTFSSIWVMDSVRLCSTHSFPDLGEINGWLIARPIEEYYR